MDFSGWSSAMASGKLNQIVPRSLHVYWPQSLIILVLRVALAEKGFCKRLSPALSRRFAQASHCVDSTLEVDTSVQTATSHVRAG